MHAVKKNNFVALNLNLKVEKQIVLMMPASKNEKVSRFCNSKKKNYFGTVKHWNG